MEQEGQFPHLYIVVDGTRQHSGAMCCQMASGGGTGLWKYLGRECRQCHETSSCFSKSLTVPPTFLWICFAAWPDRPADIDSTEHLLADLFANV